MSMLAILVLVLSMSCSDRYPFLSGDRCAPCECNDQDVVTSCKLAAEIGVLAVLDLRGKGITGIAKGAFDGLDSINALLLQDNLISNLTTAIQGAQQVYTVFVSAGSTRPVTPPPQPLQYPPPSPTPPIPTPKPTVTTTTAIAIAAATTSLIITTWTRSSRVCLTTCPSCERCGSRATEGTLLVTF